MKNDIKKILFTEQQLMDKVAELGARITEDYEGKNPLIVSVLKGSYVFMADLTRKIDTACNVDFMVVSSYG
ncbi:MAG: hypoxanthine phosphoribosyltransferase, partial [Butyricicoccus pullicaecorum]|nr:hypoxanthine phosphoribosyltransferase [Butyricicoccus pullicaecorum]